MNDEHIGLRFEKYVQRLFLESGIRAPRNFFYEGRKRCYQIDLAYEHVPLIRSRKIVAVECKYVGNGSVAYREAHIQLLEILDNTPAGEGLLVTNAKVCDKENKGSFWARTGVLDCFDLFDMAGLKKGALEDRLEALDDAIRNTEIDPDMDYGRINVKNDDFLSLLKKHSYMLG